MFLTGALQARLASICRRKVNDMLDYVSVTPLFEPIVNWAEYAPYESSKTARDTFSQHTRPVGSKGELSEWFVPRTGVNAPTPIQDTKLDRFSTHVFSPREPAPNPDRDARGLRSNVEIDGVAKQRVRLLAAKYASNNATVEMVARLEILNQRMLDRSPRVLQHQVEALEMASEKLSRISMAREERARRLGISA